MGIFKRPRLRLPHIHLPRLPNPIEVVTDAVKTAAKAIDEVAHLPKKVGKELERDVRRISNGLAEARKDVKREAKGAIHLITDAQKAAAKFALKEAEGAGKTVRGALHRRDVFSSVWYLATNPIKTTNKNAMQATRDSALLAAAAQVAATAYGGPAGAAAYAAWTAYNLSGGDINAALRAGVTTGLIAAATGAVANLPAGPQQVTAQTALKVAIAQAQGKNSEETAQLALASLVQVASANLSISVDQSQLDSLQKGIVSGALSGAAVAAAGGDSDAVRKSFVTNGGAVLVQGLRSKAEDIADSVEDSATAFVTKAIDKEDLDKLKEEFKKATDAIKSAEAIVAEAKQEVDEVVRAAKSAADATLAEVRVLHAQTQVQVDAARARLIQAREEAESRVKLVQEEATRARDQIQGNLAKEIAAGKGSADTARAAAEIELAKVKQKADNVVVALEKELADVLAAEEKIVVEGLLRLEESRAFAINEVIGAGGPAVALSREWVLSWDPKLVQGTEAVGVVLTFAGPGSEIDGVLDKVESPPEAH